jgi:hypothetical protein
MKKENVVSDVMNLHQTMNELSVDKINEMAPAAEVPVTLELTAKQRAKNEGVQYIEPRRKMQPLGKLPEKLQKQRNHDWEYVKGIYENYVVNGEPIRFWYVLYPGDPDCEWEVPANRPVYVPRMIARHLEECQRYHTFSYIQKPDQQWSTDDFTHQFSPTGTNYRGKFRSIGAFA